MTEEAKETGTSHQPQPSPRRQTTPLTCDWSKHTLDGHVTISKQSSPESPIQRAEQQERLESRRLAQEVRYLGNILIRVLFKNMSHSSNLPDLTFACRIAQPISQPRGLNESSVHRWEFLIQQVRCPSVEWFQGKQERPILRHLERSERDVIFPKKDHASFPYKSSTDLETKHESEKGEFFPFSHGTRILIASQTTNRPTSHPIPSHEKDRRKCKTCEIG